VHWARMFFVLQDCQKILVGGKELGEDVSAAGKDSGNLSASGSHDHAAT